MPEQERRIGVVSIIVENRRLSARRVNEILSEHGEIIIGRMGLPYEPKGVHVIALIINGTTDDIGALTGKLGALENVQIKSALNKI